MTYESILCFAQEWHEPVVSPKDVAEHFDVTNDGARWRLDKLVEQGKMGKKTPGSSACVYWIKG